MARSGICVLPLVVLACLPPGAQSVLPGARHAVTIMTNENFFGELGGDVGTTIFGWNSGSGRVGVLSDSAPGGRLMCPRRIIQCANCTATLIGWATGSPGAVWCSDGTMALDIAAVPVRPPIDASSLWWDSESTGTAVPALFPFDAAGPRTWMVNSTNATVNVTVHVFGAGGGGSDGASGGAGAYVTGTLQLTANTTLRLIVGQGGLFNVQQQQSNSSGGGGAGGYLGGQGGGRSEIAEWRNGAWRTLVVAGGGGGGGGCSSSGGAASWRGHSGNGTTRATPLCWMFDPTVLGGLGGSSSSGGSSGYPAGPVPALFNYTMTTPFDHVNSTGSRGMGGNAVADNHAGGGGGGYFGGAAAVNAGGGGGSSYTGLLVSADGADGSGAVPPAVTLPQFVGSQYYLNGIGAGGAAQTQGGHGLILLDYSRPTVAPAGVVSPSWACTPLPTSLACPSVSPSPSPTANATSTPSPTTTVSPSYTPTPTGTTSTTPSATGTPSRTTSVTPSQTGTSSPSPTASLSVGASRSAIPTGSASATSTATSSATKSATATSSASASRTATATASTTATSTATRTSSATRSATASATASRTASATATATASASSTPTGTASGTATATATVGTSPSTTSSGTPTASGTATPTATASSSSSSSATASASATSSETASASATASASGSGSATATATTSSSASASATATESSSQTATASATASSTSSSSATSSATASASSSASATATATNTATASATPTPSQTPSPTSSSSPSALPLRPVLALSFELRNLTSLEPYFAVAAREELKSALLLVLNSSEPYSVQGIQVVSVHDASVSHQRPQLFAARRLQGGGTAAVAVRTLVEDPHPATMLTRVTRNVDSWQHAVLVALQAINSAQYGADTALVLTDATVPPVRFVPGPASPEERLLLGLPLFVFVAILAGVAFFLLLAAITIYCVCQRRKRAALAQAFQLAQAAQAAAAAEAGPSRKGRHRRMNSFLMKNHVLSTETTGGDSSKGGREVGEPGPEDLSASSSIAMSGNGSGEGPDGAFAFANPLAVARAKKLAEQKEKEAAEAAAAKEEEARARAAALDFRVSMGREVELPTLPMEPPRPIERIRFDFPVTATTNCYWLLFLGDPAAKAAIEAAIQRAEALGGKLTTLIESVAADVSGREANLIKSGVKSEYLSEGSSLAALLRVIAGLEETHSSHGMRKAELQALQVAREDRLMLELRRAKYAELVADLKRLLASLEDTGRAAREARLAVSRAAEMDLVSFAPTTAVALQSVSGSAQGSATKTESAAAAAAAAALAVATRRAPVGPTARM